MTTNLKLRAAVFCLALGYVTAASAQVAYVYKIYKWVASGVVVGGVVAGEHVLVYSTTDKAKADEYVTNHPGLLMESHEKLMSDLQRFNKENLPPSYLQQFPHN